MQGACGLAIGLVQQGRQAAQRVAVGVLQLDDLGAKIRKELAGISHRRSAADFQHAQPGEGEPAFRCLHSRNLFQQTSP
ncbi:hypothetical protein D3C77_582480 [compost metagenome]